MKILQWRNNDDLSAEHNRVLLQSDHNSNSYDSISSTNANIRNKLFLIKRLRNWLFCVLSWHTFKKISMVVTMLIMASSVNILTPILATQSVYAKTYPYVAVLTSSVIELAVYLPAVVALIIYRRSPILMDRVSHAHAAIMGFSFVINNFVMTSSSLPRRTPPHLQGVLINTVIPATLLLRRVVLKKTVTLRRFVCTCIVMIGVFICSEPYIWQLDMHKSSKSKTSGTLYIVWPIMYGLAAIPQCVINIIFEKELDRSQVGLMIYLGWCFLYQAATALIIFWVDLLPVIGMSSSIIDIFKRLSQQLTCLVFSASNCHHLLITTWMFVVVDTLNNIMNGVVIKYSDGAIFFVNASSLETPIVTIFWTLFKASPLIHWEPMFTQTTAFTLYGLCILIPSVFVYNYFSAEDENNEQKTGYIENVSQ